MGSAAGYEALPVDGILDNSTTDFDLYLEVAGQLTMYAKAPYRWALDELKRLLDAGHRSLLHSTADRPKVEAYKALAAVRFAPSDLPPSGRVVQLTDAAAELTRILYSYPLSLSALSEVENIGKRLVATVEEDPSCVSALGKLARHDDYTYYHSARVTAYALALSIKLGLTDKTQLEQMAVGALLHDVGKSKIDLGLLNKQGALTRDEMDQMKLHPVYGDEVVRDSVLAVMPRSIIMHHHERFDGTGYPHNLTEKELLEEVKIVAFADVFDALTTNRPYQVSRTPFEALDLIKHKLLKNLHKDSYQVLVELLGDKLKADAGGA